jgi:putative transposase
LGKRPKFKSIRHYSGWTYPSKSGYKVHSIGDNGYLGLAKIGSIQMRGKARLWGSPTTCTILYRNHNWYASITVDVDSELLKASRHLNGNSSCGIDLGCLSAVSLVSLTNGEISVLPQIKPPKFFRKAEKQIKQLSKEKRRKRAPNGRKKVKASSQYKKAQRRISKVTRKVANCRQNWAHDIANRVIKSGHSLVAMEKLEVSKMTRKAKKGKRRKQKAGLNKSILDVGFGMLTAAIRYKVEEAGGTFIDVPTRQVKPSQTCPKCGNQHKKTLEERVHQCQACGFTMDRDVAAALVMLLWSLGKLPASGTGVVGGDVSSSTTKTPKRADSMRQLGQMKRQKSRPAESGLETQTSTK